MWSMTKISPGPLADWSFSPSFRTAAKAKADSSAGGPGAADHSPRKLDLRAASLESNARILISSMTVPIASRLSGRVGIAAPLGHFS